jgi:polyphenol oxidase
MKINADPDRPFLHFEILEKEPGLCAFSTTRLNGISEGPFAGLNLGLNTSDRREAVLENRRRLAGIAGLEADRIAYMRQVHGDRIIELGPDFDPQQILECDGLVTDQAGLLLAVQTADCLAVAAVDVRKRVIGVAHAGWRGALQEIGFKLIARMKKQYGCQAADIKAGLSPCIGPCHLTLGPEQISEFADVFGKERTFWVPGEDKKFKFDLWKCLTYQMQKAGVPNENIEIQDICTFCNPEFFYSFRRDGKETGRGATICGFIH